jgi:hypothetical protein
VWWPYWKVADVLTLTQAAKSGREMRVAAQNMGDTETQVRKLAAKYLSEAEDIESKESDGQHEQPYSGGLSSLEKTYR